MPEKEHFDTDAGKASRERESYQSEQAMKAQANQNNHTLSSSDTHMDNTREQVDETFRIRRAMEEADTKRAARRLAEVLRARAAYK